MKKTLIKLCSVAAIGLALTACNNDAANKQAQDADNAAIDQMVQDKVKMLDDSLTKACEDKVALAADEKLKAEPAKPGTKPVAHHSAPAKPATPAKKDEPKPTPTAGGMHSHTDQQQTQTGGGMHSKTDQQQSQTGGGGMHSKVDKK